MPKLYGYGRVSTGQQMSLSDQKRTVAAWIEYAINHDPKYASYEVGGWYQESVSAKSVGFLQRDAGSLLAAALEEGDVIVVSNFDRLIRSGADIHAVQQHMKLRGATFIALDFNIDTSQPIGQTCMEIMASIKSLEASEIRRRMVNGKRNRAREIGFNGFPFGWKDTGIRNTVEPDYTARLVGELCDEWIRANPEVFDRRVAKREMMKNPVFVNAARSYGTTDTVDDSLICRAAGAACLGFPLMSIEETSKHYFGLHSQNKAPLFDMRAIRTVSELRRQGLWVWHDPAEKLTAERLKSMDSRRHRFQLGANAVS